MTDLSKIIFSPKNNINKAIYTPDVIVEKNISIQIDYVKKKVKNSTFTESEIETIHEYYNMSRLIGYLGKHANKEMIEAFYQDFPSAANKVKTCDGEYLVHVAVWNVNLEVLEVVLRDKASHSLKDFDDSSVYENALFKPETWDLVFKNMSTVEMYEKITTTEAQYLQDASYEVLFKNTKVSNSSLKLFKLKFPEVYKEIILNKKDQPFIKKGFNTPGELQWILMDYDLLYNELNSEHEKNPIISSLKTKKF